MGVVFIFGWHWTWISSIVCYHFSCEIYIGSQGSIWLTSLLTFIYGEMDDFNVCSLTSNEPYFSYFHDEGRFTMISTSW
jgi:hypothetical protein